MSIADCEPSTRQGRVGEEGRILDLVLLPVASADYHDVVKPRCYFVFRPPLPAFDPRVLKNCFVFLLGII